MIYLGIDDTDVVGSRGTNQLARAMVAALANGFRCVSIIRHQLLVDPRVPCTTQNGSASIMLEPRGHTVLDQLAEMVRSHMLSWFVDGSDPGMCMTESVPAEVMEFGRRSKRELVSQQEARELAHRHGMVLEGLGGTCDGVIGALAAVGLAATGDDGRLVQLAEWPDNVSGIQSVESLASRGVTVRFQDDGRQVDTGLVNIGKKLRPNRRQGTNVLFVSRPHVNDHEPLTAVKLP